MGQQKEETGGNGKGFLLTLKNTFSQTTVEPYLFFCLLGYTARLVSFQSLLMDRSCRNIYEFGDEICGDLDKHLNEKLKSSTSGNNLYTGVMLLGSLPAAIVAVFLGPWSDKYTRKYPMIMSATGMFLEALASAILTFFPGVSPIWYVAASIFTGLSGGFIISVSSAASYISDITDERSRAGRFAVVEFANICAIVIGNLIGGQIYKSYGYLEVLAISPISFGCAILYAIIFIKETKSPIPKERICEVMRDLLRLDNIKQSYNTCSKKRPGSIRLQIWLLIYISFWQRFTDMGMVSILFSFTNKMYEWDVTDVSNASIYFYIVNAIVTVVFIPVMSNKLKLHEAALGFCGMLSMLSKVFVTSLAFKEFLFYFAWFSGTLSTASYISVKSRLSKLVRKEELGSAFSLLGTCESITPLLGSTALLQILNAAPDSFVGLPFAVAGLLLIPCLFIYVWMMGLPTVSFSDFERDVENVKATPLQNVTTSTYNRLQEEKF
ncbi:proton-coupled folate transporter-like [Argiope bruennichi]|uniref:proton-coupled folate transporter-like n=1 Tax=Argiope bruennichi TaxID=94029 RepID=UPI0024953154|nr:proton-coupled folate transporter-like [Argiope bruennichi]XP_055949739.1 proton-coupled folate transporter-like [Argiope bruennichi]XP_055949740.1 proton-coupled folate transporter-like [Argiope bruennichi]XP_055949741.1 proton-coupled folate transporter-like [Argiope bruennichi]